MKRKRIPTGNPAGRPQEHDRLKIAEDLVIWSKKDTSINLCAFCGENDIDPCNITQWANECVIFHKAYSKAKSLLGARREKKLSEGTLHQKAYHLNANTYDHFLKTETREEKLFDHELQKKMVEFMHVLKKEITEHVSDDVKAQFDSLMEQITMAQSKKKK